MLHFSNGLICRLECIFLAVLISGTPSGGQSFQVLYRSSALGNPAIVEQGPSGFGIATSSGKTASIVIMKTDLAGNLQWAKSYRGPQTSFNYPMDIKWSADGGLYFVAPYTASQSTEVLGSIIVKLDEDGDIQWTWRLEKWYGNFDALLPLQDGVLLATYSSELKAVVLLRIGLFGQLSWNKVIKDEIGNFHFDFHLFGTKPNGGILLGYSTYSSVGTNLQFDHSTILEMDSVGQIKRGRRLKNVAIRELEAFPDGRLLANGLRMDTVFTTVTAVLDTQLEVDWANQYYISDQPLYGHASIYNNGILLTSDYQPDGGSRILLGLDNEGQTVWKKAFPKLSAFDGSVPRGHAGLFWPSFIASNELSLTLASFGPDGDYCTPAVPCNLKARPFPLIIGDGEWQESTTVKRIREADLVATPVSVQASTYCIDVNPSTAEFTLEDSILCTGNELAAKRRANWGKSVWTQNEGVPFTSVDNSPYVVPLLQAGIIRILHSINQAGCKYESLYALPVLSGLNAGLPADTLLCRGASLSLHLPLEDNIRIKWQDGTESKKYEINKPGLYSVQATDGRCAIEDSILVKWQDPKFPELGLDTAICAGAEFFLTDKSNHNWKGYKWNDGSNEQTFTVESPGYYTLEVNDGICTTSDTVEISMRHCPDCEVFFPTVFSPNGDGINDFWVPALGCAVAGFYDLKIFDRWGSLVFQSKDPSVGWDGKTKKKNVETGPYIYTFSCQLDNNAWKFDLAQSGMFFILK